MAANSFVDSAGTTAGALSTDCRVWPEAAPEAKGDSVLCELALLGVGVRVAEAVLAGALLSVGAVALAVDEAAAEL